MRRIAGFRLTMDRIYDAGPIRLYRGADKSLALPWKETSYSEQDLQHYTNTYGVQTTGIYCVVFTP